MVTPASSALSQPAQASFCPKNNQAMAKIPAGTKTESDSTPSRDSHDERHCEKARQARSGWPRWNVEAISPNETSPRETPIAREPNQRLSGRRVVLDRIPIRNSKP